MCFWCGTESIDKKRNCHHQCNILAANFQSYMSVVNDWAFSSIAWLCIPQIYEPHPCTCTNLTEHVDWNKKNIDLYKLLLHRIWSALFCHHIHSIQFSTQLSVMFVMKLYVWSWNKMCPLEFYSISTLERHLVENASNWILLQT